MAQPQALVLPATGGTPDLAHGSILFVGTATVILRYAGFTILTDPNFLHRGDHVHIGYGLTSKRLTEPALAFENLPPIDLMLLSHLHEDHFDRLVADRLARTTTIVTTPQAAEALGRKGFTSMHPLDTWQSLRVNKGNAALAITATPAKHGPGLLQRLLPQTMGSMLEFSVGAGRPLLRLYQSGDTLLHDALREIPVRYPEVDLALIHLGGTRVGGILLTMDATQGVEAVRLIGATTAIPLHYNDYTVFRSPLEDFQRAVTAAGLEGRVAYLRYGDTYAFNVPGSRIDRAARSRLG
jgi:L-ascorbate metabolism protein UlaG (beta-lactamase superfamily)